jgi:hypothetical protein
MENETLPPHPDLPPASVRERPPQPIPPKLDAPSPERDSAERAPPLLPRAWKVVTDPPRV